MRGVVRICVIVVLFSGAARAEAVSCPPTKSVALLIADWRKASHPEALFSNILRTYSPSDGKGVPSKLRVASVYRDLPSKDDLSVKYAEQYRFAVSPSVEAALTLGTGKLAVDGVLISTEWAPYPESDTGNIQYPHRRLFEQCVKVFKSSGRVVPVFIDKHLADTYADSRWIYDTAREMKIPLMAGSSIPLCLLESDSTVERGAALKEIVGVSYHTLTTYGFHGLEMTQALAERRKGGETGVKRVRCVSGKSVWDLAGKEYNPALLDAAVAKQSVKLPDGKKLADVVAEPILFAIDYTDGLRVNLFTLNGFAMGWSASWRYADGRTGATHFAGEHTPKRVRFDWQMKGVEDMILRGKPSWPVERTLYTSSLLDAGMISKRDGGRTVDTPLLNLKYEFDGSWKPEFR